MAGLSYAFDANAGETPQSVTQKRQLADALAARIFGRAPTNVGEGLNAIGQALIARTMGQDADAAQKAGMATIPSWAGGTASPSAGIASAITGQPPLTPSAAVASAPMGNIPAAPQTDTTGKIYSNDEPSPLDPPSGADRQAMIQTILGEAGNQPALGQQAVASVIRNRAVDGGYGGDTPSQVVQAPNQFEPWNTAVGRARMASAAANPALAAKADAAISAAYGEGGKAPDDPTEGKTMFYAPAAQAALGRPAPSWAQGPGQKIGDHVFFDDNSDLPANSQVAQSGAPAGVPAPAPVAASPAAKNYGGPFASVSNEDLQKAAFNPWLKAANPVAAQAMATEITRRATIDQQANDPLRQLQIKKAQQDLEDKTPIGFQKTDKGLEPIPGGPADPAYLRAKAAQSADPNAIKVLGRGGELYKTGPDGNPVIVHKNETETALLDDQTTDAMAAQYLAGDKSVMTNLGRGAQGAANVIKLRTAIYRQAQEAGLNGRDIVDNFNEQAGALAGQRAVGTRAANISLAANEANNMIPIALAASDKLPRSQFMPWNQMVQAVQKGSSSPELASFVAATNSLVNSYVRAVSPSGVPTDSMREHAYSMLNAAQGPEAYKAVIQTMQQEMKAALEAPSQVKKELRHKADETPTQDKVQSLKQKYGLE